MSIRPQFFTRLESLRGVAAILVVFFHSPFIDGSRNFLIANGDLFVDVFFILSGFIISFAYLDKIDRGLGFGTFVVQRLGRLYPLHLFFLFIWLGFIWGKYLIYSQTGVGQSPFGGDGWYTAEAFAYNLVLLHSMGVLETVSWNHPSWSISVEFYTYLVFFGLVLCTAALFRTMRWPLIFVTMLVSYGLLFWFTREENSLLKSADYGFLRCVGGFCLGMFVYRIAPWTWRVPGPPIVQTVMELSVVALFLGVIAVDPGLKVIELALFIIMVGLIALFAAQSEGFVSRILRSAPLVLAGKISYSIYMSHAVVLMAAGNAAGPVFGLPRIGLHYDTPWAWPINLALLGVILVISWGTYRWVELPARNWVKHRFAPKSKAAALNQ
ncbi:MAG: acyltransferase [Pseudomonadota bacterium]